MFEALESQRLQDIYERFGGHTDVVKMLATTAMLRGVKMATERADAALAPFGLTMPRYEVLGLIAHAPTGRMSLRDLKRATMLHPSTMTYTIDWLEGRGWLNRVQDRASRRTVIAEVTDSGRKVANEALAALAQMHFGLGEFTDAEALTIAVLLSRLHRDGPLGTAHN